MKNIITLAVEQAGGRNVIAAEFAISRQAVRKWEIAGHLPRTEWTGETDYATQIARLSKGVFTKDQLLSRRPERKPAAT